MQDQQRTCGRPTVSSVRYRYCTPRCSRGVLPTDKTLVPYCMVGARHSPRVPRFHVASVLFPVRSHTCQISPPAVDYWIASYVETYSTVRHTMTTLFLSVGFVVACHTSQLIQFASCSTENKHNNKREDELGWHTQPFAAVSLCILLSPSLWRAGRIPRLG
jgi:hypothetical protein